MPLSVTPLPHVLRSPLHSLQDPPRIQLLLFLPLPSQARPHSTPARAAVGSEKLWALLQAEETATALHACRPGCPADRGQLQTSKERATCIHAGGNPARCTSHTLSTSREDKARATQAGMRTPAHPSSWSPGIFIPANRNNNNITLRLHGSLYREFLGAVLSRLLHQLCGMGVIPPATGRVPSGRHKEPTPSHLKTIKTTGPTTPHGPCLDKRFHTPCRQLTTPAPS